MFAPDSVWESVFPFSRDINRPRVKQTTQLRWPDRLLVVSPHEIEPPLCTEGIILVKHPRFSGDPLLGPLADNDGGTQTHALRPGSWAIDATKYTLTTDQRGISRPAGANCDIGAFEMESDVWQGGEQKTLIVEPISSKS